MIHPRLEQPNGTQERTTMPQWRQRIAALLLACAASWLAPTAGRSSATRGGVCTAKPLGTAASGADSSMRTTSAPACWVLVID